MKTMTFSDAVLAVRQFWRRLVGKAPLIYTTHGYLPRDVLAILPGEIDNEHECTQWIEYYHAGELVRRDVHVRLKQMPPLFAAQESI